MNHHEVSKYNMYQKMVAFFQNVIFNVIWVGFPRIVMEIANFVTLNGKLLDLIQQQELDITGKTQDKNAAYLRMYTLIVDAAKKAYTWAKDNSNKDLMELFNVNMSDFKHLLEAEGYAKVKNIRDALNANIALLVSVELIPADIATIDGVITVYESLLGMMGTAKQHKEEGTKGIENIMIEMDESLDTIDKLLVSQYKYSNADMVSEYLGDRNIDKLPTHHSGISAHIVDNLSGKNLQGVIMTMETKTATSDISGIAEIIETKWGIFNVTFACGNYVTQTIEVTIERGKVTKIEVRMNIKIVPAGA